MAGCSDRKAFCRGIHQWQRGSFPSARCLKETGSNSCCFFFNRRSDPVKFGSQISRSSDGRDFIIFLRRASRGRSAGEARRCSRRRGLTHGAHAHQLAAHTHARARRHAHTDTHTLAHGPPDSPADCLQKPGCHGDAGGKVETQRTDGPSGLRDTRTRAPSAARGERGRNAPLARPLILSLAPAAPASLQGLSRTRSAVVVGGNGAAAVVGGDEAAVVVGGNKAAAVAGGDETAVDRTSRPIGGDFF